MRRSRNRFARAALGSLLCLGLLAASAIVPTKQKIVLDKNQRTQFKETATNRTMILHGMNVVVKAAPYYPEPLINGPFDPLNSLVDEDLTKLRDELGINWIRLGIMWESVERAPGQYNETYLKQMNDLVTYMGEKYGIYTMVDSHQDDFTRQFCGEGIPTFHVKDQVDHTCDYNPVSWVAGIAGLCKPIASFDLRYDPKTGLPLIEDCIKRNFVTYSLTPEIASGFEMLYTNKNDLRTKFFDYWAHVAIAFRDNPWVIGYDIINEPMGANYFHDPTLLLPGKTDSRLLEPLYRDWHKMIRAHDKEKIVFFEPTQASALPVAGGVVFHAGFTNSPDKGVENYSDKDDTAAITPYFGGTMMNDHSYCCIGVPCDSDGSLPLDQAYKCKIFHENKIGKRVADAKALNGGNGVGLILSEFGACPDSEYCYEEISAVTEVCDDHLVSWAYWMYKGFGDFTTQAPIGQGLFNEDGTYQPWKAKALKRTYAQAVQGHLVNKMRFDKKRGTFELQFELNLDSEGKPEISAPTIIWLDRERWSENGAMKLSGRASCTLDGVPTDCQDELKEDLSNMNKVEWTIGAGGPVVLKKDFSNKAETANGGVLSVTLGLEWKSKTEKEEDFRMIEELLATDGSGHVVFV